jgi:hypothetical protein
MQTLTREGTADLDHNSDDTTDANISGEGDLEGLVGDTGSVGGEGEPRNGERKDIGENDGGNLGDGSWLDHFYHFENVMVSNALKYV